MDAAVLVFWARKARSVSARSAQHCPAPVLGAWRLLWRFRQVHSRYLGSSARPVTSRNTGATGLTLVFFFFPFPGQLHVSHSIPGLGFVFLVLLVHLPLVCGDCMTCFTEKGKSERFLLEMTPLIFLEPWFLGLWALGKLLLAQNSRVGNTALCQRGSWHISAYFCIQKERKSSWDWLTLNREEV